MASSFITFIPAVPTRFPVTKRSTKLHSIRCTASPPSSVKQSQRPSLRKFMTVLAAVTITNLRPIPPVQSEQLSQSAPISSPLVHHKSTSKLKFATVSVTIPNRTLSNQNSIGIRALLPAKTDPVLNKTLKVALLLGISTVIITAVTIAVFWIIQDSLVYKPTKVWRGNPESAGMPYYEDVQYCTIDGVEISGWFIRQPPHLFQKARTLIYFHGTDKNASFRLKKVVGLYQHCNCNILLVSYRGYGLSTGKPNERGFRIDADSAYHYLKSRGDVDVSPGGNLWVYGESLGGAVAVHFSEIHQNSINALILENTFTSLLDMIKLEFPILGVFRYLSRNRWQSKKRIGKLNIPLLFLSGLKDSYIPPQMMKKMYNLAISSPMKEFVEFENGTHNRTWRADGFWEEVAKFMDRVDSSQKPREVIMTGVSQSSTGRVDDGGNYVATA